MALDSNDSPQPLFSAKFPQNKERSEIASLKEERSQVMCVTLFSCFRPRRKGN